MSRICVARIAHNNLLRWPTALRPVPSVSDPNTQSIHRAAAPHPRSVAWHATAWALHCEAPASAPVAQRRGRPEGVRALVC